MLTFSIKPLNWRRCYYWWAREKFPRFWILTILDYKNEKSIITFGLWQTASKPLERIYRRLYKKEPWDGTSVYIEDNTEAFNPVAHMPEMRAIPLFYDWGNFGVGLSLIAQGRMLIKGKLLCLRLSRLSGTGMRNYFNGRKRVSKPRR